MIPRRWRWLGAVALLALCLPVWAQPRPLVLVGPPWPPYLDPTEKKQGFASEVVIAALQAVGYDEIEIRLQPWRRVLWDARNQAADALIGIWHSPEREALVRFSEPYYVSPIVAILPATSDRQLQGIDDLAGLDVVHREGARFGRAFDEAGHFRHVAVNQTENVLNMVQAGRVDVGVEDGLIVRSLLLSNPEYARRLRLSREPLLKQPLYFGVIRGRPGSDALLEDFNRGLRLIRMNGTYERILEDNAIAGINEAGHLSRSACVTAPSCEPDSARTP